MKPLLQETEKAYRRWDNAEVERLLLEAHHLAPWRLDIMYNMAGRYIQSGEIEKALAWYKRILAAAPRDVDALTMCAHWSKHLGLAENSATALAALAAARPERAQDLRRIWLAIDADAAGEVRYRLAPEKAMRQAGDKAAIVILGYKLNPDASIHRIMLDRLTKGLEAAELWPESRIVVCGGVPRDARVEAAVMKQWLRDKGVAADRIHEEGYSRDVVENLLYARHILEMLRVKRALIVTSAIDCRRAGIIAGIVAWANGSSTAATAVAARQGDSGVDCDAGPGEIKIYRDSLRAYGMLMMRSFPELVEL